MPHDEEPKEEQKTIETVNTTSDAMHGAAQDSGRPFLTIYHRTGMEMVPLLPHCSLIIGRVPPANVVVEDSSISRTHARIDLVGDQVWIEDLKSTNGTSVNGAPIDRAQLSIGDRVTMGKVLVSLHRLTLPGGRLKWLESHDRFLDLVENEVTRSRTFGRKLALLMVRAAEDVEGQIEEQIDQWCTRVRHLLRPVDQMGLYGPEVVEALLPETGLERATRVANSIVFNRPTSDPALLCSIAIFPDAGGSTDELIEICRTALREASSERPIQAFGHDDLPSTTSFGTAVRGDSRGMVIASRAMEEIDATIETIAPAAIPVLIIGETGTGKEVIARAIHDRSDRQSGPMLCVNCGAIPEHLVESALFGHERGAFTGADRRFRGVFEDADGGSLLLDEIGELSLHSQVALLRVLDTKRITRVGSNKEIGVDVRIIAATHQDLQKRCEEGAFRSDLYYRLNTMVLQVPPLRDRSEEVRPLAEHFARLASEVNNRQVTRIAPGALEALERYDWPGNVRELRNVIERAVVIAQEDVITSDDLPRRLRRYALPGLDARSDIALRKATTMEVAPLKVDPARVEPAKVASGEIEPLKASGGSAVEEGTAEEVAAKEQRSSDTEDTPTFPEDQDFKTRVGAFERILIIDALRASAGNQTRAAQLLGITRFTLINKMHQYRVESEVLEAEPSGPVSHLKERIERFETELIEQALAQTDGDTTRAAARLGLPKYTLHRRMAKYGIT